MVSNPAGFWRRLAANLLDGLIVGVPLAIISYFITGSMEGDPITSIINLAYFLLIPIYWSGYTIGKRIMGVRIVKVNGEKLGFGAMFLRTIVASLVYVVTLGIALIVSAIMVGVRRDKRAIHDFIAGTYVTTERP
ncbi:putative RDD family membrane protein YckC [Thermolongibacillus altinsuensis]|uniref:Putative RDD family membrane protein YckC n=1 Tax=Thermolongibacillus altinsuensis TaxID=575256 RepID=A0A4R1QSS0_9BACL|nr:RDD family protein [Thermolongibacillus altinsuensis]TCL53110.1 putative RDD family membrane protein YckC [Thermolongibacillus altinsuensis]